MASILIVDDERAICTSLRFALEDAYSVLTAVTAAEALTLADRLRPDLALLDLRLGEQDGQQVMLDLKRANPETVVVMMTAHASIRTAVECMKAGAFHYLTKPLDIDELRVVAAKGLSFRRMADRIEALEQEVAARYRAAGTVAVSAAMQAVFALVERAKGVDSSVLITGESGTGKELVARALHFQGPRRQAAFEVTNCAAIPRDLVESQLFGHEKGAFTGAQRTHRGLFERADGGTLFLDEIGELDLSLQAKLLRILQDKMIQPVGSEQTRRVDVRVIAATNKNLWDLVQAGLFRADLYFRLNVIPIHVPPLRDRPADIPVLVDQFLDRLATDTGRRCSFTDRALEALMRYRFPGNVRELQNTVERCVVLSLHAVLDVTDLPPEVLQHDHGCPESRGQIQVALGERLADVERRVIVETLRHCRGNRRKTAALLGISERGLRNKLNLYRIAE